jgi:hypothetical protein
MAVFVAKGQGGSIPGDDARLTVEVSSSTLDDDLASTMIWPRQ